MKKSRAFLRSFILTFVIIFCLSLFIVGIAVAYNQMNITLNAEYEKAFYIDSGGLKILDFYIPFK